MSQKRTDPSFMSQFGNDTRVQQLLLQTMNPAGAEFDSLLDATDALVGMYDPQDNLSYTNAAFRNAYFVEKDETINWADMIRRNHAHNRGTILQTDDIEVWILSTKSRRGKVANRSFEMDLHDGRWIWAMETVQSNGWMLFIGLDMTSVRQEERTLRMDRDYALKASHTDDLTGVSNRRHIMEMLKHVIAGSGGCACLLDIDFFKRINDRFGHQVGDEALVNFVRKLRNAVRLADSLGRVGGEEFLLIMPGVTLTEAADIVARIYAEMHQARLIPSQPDYPVTFSAGLTKIAPDDTPQAVFSRCDEQLYRAKHSGRNQLQIFKADRDDPGLGQSAVYN